MQAGKTPAISIVIPCKNEAANLAFLLDEDAASARACGGHNGMAGVEIRLDPGATTPARALIDFREGQ